MKFPWRPAYILPLRVNSLRMGIIIGQDEIFQPIAVHARQCCSYSTVNIMTRFDLSLARAFNFSVQRRIASSTTPRSFSSRFDSIRFDSIRLDSVKRKKKRKSERKSKRKSERERKRERKRKSERKSERERKREKEKKEERKKKRKHSPSELLPLAVLGDVEEGGCRVADGRDRLRGAW